MKTWNFFKIVSVPPAALAIISVWTAAIAAGLPPAPVPPVPKPEQRAWQEHELTMFCHFGVNTFTDREWGDGKEDPTIFNPVRLDCRQWARTAKEAGFKLMILTAKHHDGFCLWPSKHTDHSVKNSAWKNGGGDVVREFTEACHAEDLRVGIYLSPWDRHERVYGTDAYNTHFTNQLTELLTQYGTVDEVWFDGACGEGPNGKRQVYDWPAYYATIRALAPHAVIAIVGPDIRWVGNESGVARPGESSVQPNGVWYPAECDVSIRPGWFFHAHENNSVKSLDRLLDIYLKSVGRNSVLLLNVPPNREGLFSDPDVRRLREFGALLREVFGSNLAKGALASTEPAARGTDFAADNVIDNDRSSYWAAADGVTNAVLTLELAAPLTFNAVSVREPFWLGERSQRYRLEVEAAAAPNGWKTLARGTVIGSRNILPLPDTTARRVRLTIEQARAVPAISEFSLHRLPKAERRASMALSALKPATASNVHPQGTAFGADRAVDDDPDTRWATADGTTECWLEVDLDRVEAFNRIAIAEMAPRIKQFSIEYRENKESPWQEAFQDNNAGSNYERRFGTVKGRYIRLHILDASEAPTIWEFQVFAP